MVRSGCRKVKPVVVPFAVENVILMTGSLCEAEMVACGRLWAGLRGTTWWSCALVVTMQRTETVGGSVRWVYVALMMSVVVVEFGELHKLWGLL
jgi:hypothetical protein